MKQTQWAKINEYLKNNKYATVRHMFNDLGINCPTKRISEMRDAGVPIKDYWQEYVDEYGDKTRYKVYYLG